jgi:hypothetical protein
MKEIPKRDNLSDKDSSQTPPGTQTQMDHIPLWKTAFALIAPAQQAYNRLFVGRSIDRSNSHIYYTSLENLQVNLVKNAGRSG